MHWTPLSLPAWLAGWLAGVQKKKKKKKKKKEKEKKEKKKKEKKKKKKKKKEECCPLKIDQRWRTEKMQLETECMHASSSSSSPQ